MLIYLAVAVFIMHPDATYVSQFYEMSWHTSQHCETEYEPYIVTIHHLRITSDVFLLTMLVILADADKVFPICIFR